MERQIQKLGVRKWYGDQWIKLQDQIYKSIEKGLLGQINDNIVLGGCEISDNGDNYNVAEGIVFIDGEICVFNGIKDTTLPFYLTKKVTETTPKQYADGQSKPTEKHYKANASTESVGVHGITLSQTIQPKLITCYFDNNGNLQGIPKSDSVNNASSNTLATSVAVRTLFATKAATTHHHASLHDASEVAKVTAVADGINVAGNINVGADKKIGLGGNSAIWSSAEGTLRIDILGGNYEFNSFDGNAYAPSGKSWIDGTSDERLKRNIVELDSTLEKIKQLRPVLHLWKSDDESKTEPEHLGFIAQEVEELFPELVGTRPDDYKYIHYKMLVVPLTKAIQEQQQIIEAQKAEIETLKSDITAIKQHLNI
jgi:hypothetical protein